MDIRATSTTYVFISVKHNETLCDAGGATYYLQEFFGASWVMSFVCIFIVLLNLCIIILFMRLRSSTSFSECFICNLAVADLLTGAIATIKTLPLLSIEIGKPNKLFCLFQVIYIYVCCCMSLFAMCSISLERLWFVTYPIKYRTKKASLYKWVFILVPWILPIVLFFIPIIVNYRQDRQPMHYYTGSSASCYLVFIDINKPEWIIYEHIILLVPIVFLVLVNLFICSKLTHSPKLVSFSEKAREKSPEGDRDKSEPCSPSSARTVEQHQFEESERLATKTATQASTDLGEKVRVHTVQHMTVCTQSLDHQFLTTKRPPVACCSSSPEKLKKDEPKGFLLTSSERRNEDTSDQRMAAARSKGKKKTYGAKSGEQIKKINANFPEFDELEKSKEADAMVSETTTHNGGDDELVPTTRSAQSKDQQGVYSQQEEERMTSLTRGSGTERQSSTQEGNEADNSGDQCNTKIVSGLEEVEGRPADDAHQQQPAQRAQRNSNRWKSTAQNILPTCSSFPWCTSVIIPTQQNEQKTAGSESSSVKARSVRLSRNRKIESESNDVERTLSNSLSLKITHYSCSSLRFSKTHRLQCPRLTLLTMLTVTLLLTWLPYVVFRLIEGLCATLIACTDPRISRIADPCDIVRQVVIWMVYLQSAWNPLMYGFYHKSYRAALAKLLRQVSWGPVHIRGSVRSLATNLSA